MWDTAVSALERWYDVLRWVLKKPGIGLATSAAHESSAKRFFATKSGCGLQFYNGILNARAANLISVDSWNVAQVLLGDEFEVPIWFLLQRDALGKIINGDFRGSLLDAVAAIEVIIRERINSLFNGQQDIRNALSGQIKKWQLSDIVNSRKKIPTLNIIPLSDADVKDLQCAIDSRNGILHRGESVTRKDAETAVRLLSLFATAIAQHE